MTEKDYYSREFRKFAGSFPDMQVALVDKIVRWNYHQQEEINGTESIYDSRLYDVDDHAEDYRFDTDELYSDDVEIQREKLKDVLEVGLAEKVLKDDEFVRLFAEYVAKIIEKNHRHQKN